ncbi:MAG: hypothetical protein Q9166_006348 [cf. Caloplaca sp. 2 TL-2023]
MPPTLSPVTTASDFPALIACERSSYLSPYNALYQLFCPQNRPTVEESLREATERQLGWWVGDPTATWVKVTDSDDPDAGDGGVIGGALWHVYEKAPFGPDAEKKAHEGETCYWWPEEGRQRELADHMMNQFTYPRTQRMHRPSLLLEICYVHPEHRRRGAGNLLVGWGTKKADELGLESFVEATDDGRPLYERHGFKVVDRMEVKADLDNMDEGLRELGKSLEWEGWYMWRPVGGNWVDGETKVPWEK